MKTVENLLRETMGLDPETIGMSLIERVVRARMRHFGLTKQEEYIKLVQGAPEEWEALVESVVVTETWFYRDRSSFHAMAQFVRDEWLPQNPKGTLRLLSLPCSSGEEPYSMAMALMESSLSLCEFSIDAIDISPRALAYADKAVYGRNSFRGSDLAFRSRFFSAENQEYRLNDEVRAHVKFRRGNVLDAGCPAVTGHYDIMFFRNLLIYLDRQTRGKILMKVRDLLSPSGVLFLGAAEVPLALNNGFVPLCRPLSFACRHPDFNRTLPEPRVHFRNPAVNLLRRSDSNSRHLPMPPALPTDLDIFSERTRPTADLNTARSLVEEGHLPEAAEICEAHIREHGVSAEAYYLLGLVRNAAGAETQAGEFYRRALYLEPDHYGSLVQWASLSKRHGNQNQARLLRERAERVKKQS